MVRDHHRLNLKLVTSYFADVVALIRAAECVYLSGLEPDQQCHAIAGLLAVTKNLALEAATDLDRMGFDSFTAVIGERS